ncbi:MAG: hypothetical protein ABIT71_26555, partial [Vicinamibacteraceae bacterium]
MKKTHLAFIAVVIVAAVAYYVWRNRGGEAVAIDLFALASTESFEFRPGERKAELFKAGPETVAGETRPALF